MLNQNLIILKMKEKRTGGNFTQKVIFCFAMLVFLGSTALAQTKSISGVVKDASGETIIAASVIVKGTNIGTVTNIDGEFKLNVPANAQTLVVSYVGMKTEEVKISGNVINVTLTDNARMLDEVVAIGYGTTRRKDITGSVASVKADALQRLRRAQLRVGQSAAVVGVNFAAREILPAHTGQAAQIAWRVAGRAGHKVGVGHELGLAQGCSRRRVCAQVGWIVGIGPARLVAPVGRAHGLGVEHRAGIGQRPRGQNRRGIGTGEHRHRQRGRIALHRRLRLRQPGARQQAQSASPLTCPRNARRLCFKHAKTP